MKRSATNNAVDEDLFQLQPLKKLKGLDRPVDTTVNKKRMKRLNGNEEDVAVSELQKPNHGHEAVVYWMERDQRVNDNWALLYAQELAKKHKLILRVLFVQPTKYCLMTERYEMFKLKGLKEVEQRLRSLNIPFHLIEGEPSKVVKSFVESQKCGCVVTDFSPLRDKRKWRTDTAEKLASKSIAVVEVDTHNVVPIWEASDKVEYGARTIRTKIHRQMNDFLRDFPEVLKQNLSDFQIELPKAVDFEKIMENLDIDRSVKEVDWCISGETAALDALESFLLDKTDDRLKHYSSLRNDPNEEVISDLSPYFNFGQVSTLRSLMVAQKNRSYASTSIDAFVEESVVRSELSDNFCFYTPNYDSINAAADWAKSSLLAHKGDKREFVYTLEQFETGMTHDDLWNAAQLQLVNKGKMHGFLRMYWAKKILEWTPSPEKALEYSIYLNDKFALDGCDPNGYVGCAWSIIGIHDQGWKEREVFGKIRFMNYEGCKRKFDVHQFVSNFPLAIKNCKLMGGTPCPPKRQSKKKVMSTQKNKLSFKAKAKGSK